MELGLEKALIPSGAPLKLQRKAAEIGYMPPLHTHLQASWGLPMSPPGPLDLYPTFI